MRLVPLSLRWPALAAHLAQNPDHLEPAGAAPAAAGFEELLADREVRRVTEGLTPALIRRVVGDAGAEMAHEPAAA